MHVTVLPHLHESLGHGEVPAVAMLEDEEAAFGHEARLPDEFGQGFQAGVRVCLLYTSDAADEV